ncbi:hypothetical protein GF322_04875 [Candidatus Dependentiae bacterium]|nr:hypothetical protein [Candidatus Dependentiae bacterium]
MMLNTIKVFIPWISEFLFLVALLPQIILNYKIKSVASLSDLFLIMFFSAYSVNVFYIYGLNFPFAYKVLSPLCVLAVLIMIIQKFFYNNILRDLRTVKLYYVAFFFFLIFIPLVILLPDKIGHLSGWLLVFFWTLYQFPQIYKIYASKSVIGISFLFLSIIGIANVVELTSAILYGLPTQTYFIAMRGILFYLIYCYQFWLYKT